MNNPQRIKIILFLLLFFMASGFAGLYYFNVVTSGKKVIKRIKIDSEASLILNTMKHTSTRNGVKEWTLDASSARVMKNEDKALLMDISVFFFLKNGEQVHVTAKEGYINTKEKDIHFSNNVMVKYGETVLKTEQLHYDKKSHIINSTVHVTVTNNSSVIDADTLRINLNDNTILLKGNVCGTLSESFGFSQ
ncbi:MAG: LPS export ABC transporter periplasmic protein LptC [Desulfamplus sp.]|nr:LPS export ABC transporter periplasmic protein LptC [Desulfamplus sp.]